MLPKLYLITNSRQAAAPLPTVLRACFDAGAAFVQLREKHLSHRQLSILAERLVPLAHAHGAKMLINSYPDIVRKTGADGVHLPFGHTSGAPQAAGVVGVSAHSLAEAKLAAAQGADFITLSPVFETPSKPGYGPALGVDELARVCEAVEIPVYALAGITPERVRGCLEAGARGVAVMGGVMRAENAGAAVRAYLAQLAT